jgi:hypothetical protein
VFNRAAREGGYDVIATGHNLDDEAATLLGNTLRWQTDYIARQSPVLPAEEGFARKVKPLYRLSELETAAFAFLRGIDYVVEECPLVGGNTQLRYKDAMNHLESTRPGPRPSSCSATWIGRLRCSRRRTRSSSSGASAAASPRPAGSARSAAPRRRSWASGSESAAGRSVEARWEERGERGEPIARRRRGAVRRGHAGRDLRDRAAMIGPFEAGERILLVDQRDRRYLLTLQTGETWHSHGGGLSHDLLIGSPRGPWCTRRPGWRSERSGRGWPTSC